LPKGLLIICTAAKDAPEQFMASRCELKQSITRQCNQ